jgi:hypothetical protein
MDESQEREARQLNMMRDTLKSFESDEITIASAVSSLKSLVWELEGVTENWRNDFIGEWLHLEIEYASALDKGQTLPDASGPDIGLATARMKQMVQERLDLTQ